MSSYADQWYTEVEDLEIGFLKAFLNYVSFGKFLSILKRCPYSNMKIGTPPVRGRTKCIWLPLGGREAAAPRPSALTQTCKDGWTGFPQEEAGRASLVRDSLEQRHGDRIDMFCEEKRKRPLEMCARWDQRKIQF